MSDVILSEAKDLWNTGFFVLRTQNDMIENDLRETERKW